MGLRGVIKGVVGGSIGDPDAGALAEAGFFGKSMDLALEGHSVFGVSAGDGLRHVDAVAGLYFGEAGTDSFDDSGTIGAGCVGQRRLDGVGAVAHVSVIGIHTDGVDPHEDLSGGGLGGW